MPATTLGPFLSVPRIAYFSMEIALEPDIPTYSGGLGILAGDTMRSAVDLELPLVGVTLVSRAGYFKQEIVPPGRQVEHPERWDPATRARALGAKIAVSIEGHTVWIAAWLYVLEGERGAMLPVLLLDTDLPENDVADREITHTLYGDGQDYRLKQEIVLGIGGVQMLRALGFRVQHYHLNEGHAALLGLQLLREHEWPAGGLQQGIARYDVGAVRSLCSFTTHTPVDAGHDQFSYDLVQRILDVQAELEVLKELAGQDRLNLTRLALNLSDYVNGVAKRHAEVSGRMFPGYHVRAVTNGVHPRTWSCESFRGLYDRHFPGWCHEPEILVRIDQVPDEEVWEAHMQAKRALAQLVHARCGVELKEDVPILGFARRMTAYKRADLLFSDLRRLRGIARRQPIQIVLAGKAHPRDDEGKRLIESLHAHLRDLNGAVPGAFVPGYDMDTALLLVSGADLWLNTPLPPLEASGTSGMKAALNGVPNLSVLDGWWIEGWIEGVSGWAIGHDGPDSAAQDHARSLYDKLEGTVLPLYYDDRPGWIKVMKGAIGKNAFFFNSHRMMRRYAAEAYLRLAP
jgi:starch phosphorylase